MAVDKKRSRPVLDQAGLATYRLPARLAKTRKRSHKKRILCQSQAQHLQQLTDSTCSQSEYAEYHTRNTISRPKLQPTIATFHQHKAKPPIQPWS